MYLSTTSSGEVFKDFSVPTMIEPLTDIVHAAVSRHYFDRVFVLKKDGTVWSWGSGAHASAGL
jgi:alpha-tubulin suppressor-like RCC1 family protein